MKERTRGVDGQDNITEAGEVIKRIGSLENGDKIDKEATFKSTVCGLDSKTPVGRRPFILSRPTRDVEERRTNAQKLYKGGRKWYSKEQSM